jgi:hypothetical protein
MATRRVGPYTGPPIPPSANGPPTPTPLLPPSRPVHRRTTPTLVCSEATPPRRNIGRGTPGAGSTATRTVGRCRSFHSRPVVDRGMTRRGMPSCTRRRRRWFVVQGGTLLRSPGLLLASESSSSAIHYFPSYRWLTLPGSTESRT